MCVFYANCSFAILLRKPFNLCLIAALIFSAAYYSVPFYYDSKRSIGEVLFLINFIGVNFEAGKETREKFWSDFVAEQNEDWSEKRVVFCSYRCFLESEKLRCEKKFCKRLKFFVNFNAVFFPFFWVRGLVMIFFNFRLVLVVV